MVEAMHMRWASTLEKAIKIARDFMKKDDYNVSVIPDGVSVIILP